MTKLYIFTISAFLSLSVLAQDAFFYRLPDGLAPAIDGYTDDLWDDVQEHYIQKPFQLEEPTIDFAAWQAVWNDTAIFLLVTVMEDSYCPPWCEPAQVDWMSDKIEVWLDVNNVLADGQGPAGYPNGHYQFAPTFEEGVDNYFFSGYTYQGYCQYAYNVVEPDYVFEYVLPFSSLEDESYNVLAPFDGKQIGFDVYVVDRDWGSGLRNRLTWVNDGLGPTGDEAWNTMDDCGVVELTTETIYEGPGSSHAIAKKLPAGVAPDIDGFPDILWENVQKHDIEKPYQYEEPSLDVATWQAVWNDTALFIIIIVEEDNLCPPWCEPAQVDWLSDRTELYLDVNDILEDGQGPAGFPNGHFQFSPTFEEGLNFYFFSGYSWQGWYYQYAYDVDDPDYIFEYALPFSSLEDESFNPLVPADGKQIGFDVYVVDRDEGSDLRKRATWVNDGMGPSGDEAWNTMDDCGILEFSTETIEYGGSSYTTDAFIKKLPEGLSPAIDGYADAVWAGVEVHDIEKPFQTEIPSLYLATWQAAWNDYAIYLLVTVEEDNFCPAWCEPAQVEWMSDKVEVYFDVNSNLKDGEGTYTPGNGHYQFAPSFEEGLNNLYFSGYSWQGWYYEYSYIVSEPNYIFEYAFPLSTLENKYMNELVPAEGKQIGFDVYVVDRDEGEDIRKRTAWVNDGTGPTGDEAWNTMDDCGVLEFSTETVVNPYPPHTGVYHNYCDFETISPRPDALGDDLYVITINPAKDAANSTDNNVRYGTGTNAIFEGFMIPAGGVFFADSITSVKIRIYGTVSGLFMVMPVRSSDFLFGASSSALYTNTGSWQELEFEFPADAFLSNYDYLMFLPYNTGTGIWYFDEISGNQSIYYGGPVTVRFIVTNNSSEVLGDDNYIFMDGVYYDLYNDGTHGDLAAGDDKWTCTIYMEGFKLGIGWGDYIWQPVINNVTFSERELFVVAGQGPVQVEYSYIGITGTGEAVVSEMPQFEIYPVPASDYVYISDADRLAQAVILDVLGKEIRTVIGRQSSPMRIDISGINPGVYFLRLTDTYGLVSIRTLLKE
jgi:hypothetical protein